MTKLHEAQKQGTKDVKALDEKRVSELKEQELGMFAGKQKVSSEQNMVYAVVIDLSDPDSPRAIIQSRMVITKADGTKMIGESQQTIAPLDPNGAPFKKATAKGAQLGELGTIGDMINVLVGFSIDKVAERKAREQALAEEAAKPKEDHVVDG